MLRKSLATLQYSQKCIVHWVGSDFWAFLSTLLYLAPNCEMLKRPLATLLYAQKAAPCLFTERNGCIHDFWEVLPAEKESRQMQEKNLRSQVLLYLLYEKALDMTADIFYLRRRSRSGCRCISQESAPTLFTIWKGWRHDSCEFLPAEKESRRM